MRTLLLFFALLAFILIITRCGDDNGHKSKGLRLAENYCQNCHQLPSPGDLPQRIWQKTILPRMGAYYGIYTEKPRRAYLGNRNESIYLKYLYPEKRQIDSVSWQALQNYYIQNAPAELAQLKKNLIDTVGFPFSTRAIQGKSTNTQSPYITLIQHDSDNDSIYVGGPGERQGEIQVFSSSHVYQRTIKTLSVPAHYDPVTGQSLEIGSLLPSDHPRGSLSVTGKINKVLIDHLARPVAICVTDLDQNGEEELTIAEFGNLVGALTQYITRSDSDQYQRKILINQPGAIRLKQGDLDQDGFTDLLVLFGQGNERIVALYSRPNGPKINELLTFPPSYGSSDLEVIDFDHDGDLDLIVTNGDNFDYEPIPKSYHGLRYYENDGNQTFTERWFYPFDGAYNVEVADFDSDGDYDFAVLAYFVPTDQRELASFVYLKQLPPLPDSKELNFTATTFPKPNQHHYLCMTSGDVDKDGDIDLLLGNFGAYLPDGVKTNDTGTDQPVYIYLENNSISHEN